MPRVDYRNLNRRSASRRFAIQEAEDSAAGVYPDDVSDPHGPQSYDDDYFYYDNHDRYMYHEYASYDPRDVWGRWPGYGSDGSSDDDEEDGNGRLSLVHALSSGDLATVRSLLADGSANTNNITVDPNARDINGTTALIIAARMGNAEAVDLLLSRRSGGVRRADPHLANKRGETALHAAVIGREFFVAAPSLRKSYPTTTMMMDAVVLAEPPTAARSRSEDIVARLIAAGANLNARRFVTVLNVRRNSTWAYLTTRFAGLTALHLAVFTNHIGIARQLLASGASANIADKDGQTPLHFVGIHWRSDDRQDVLERDYHDYLLVSANAADATGGKPAMPRNGSSSSSAVSPSPLPPPPQLPYRIVTREHTMLLLSSGADASARDKTIDQWTPLHVAVFEGLAEMVTALVNIGGADVNARGRARTKPFFCIWHCVGGHARIAAFLMEEGAEVVVLAAPIRYYGAERLGAITSRRITSSSSSSVDERLRCEKAGLCRALCLAAQMGAITTIRALVVASKKGGGIASIATPSPSPSPSRRGREYNAREWAAACCWLDGHRRLVSPLQCAVAGGGEDGTNTCNTRSDSGDAYWGPILSSSSSSAAVHAFGTEWARCVYAPPRPTTPEAESRLRRRRAGIVKGLLLAGCCPFETARGGGAPSSSGGGGIFTGSPLLLASRRGLVGIVRLLLRAMGPRHAWPTFYADGPLALEAAAANGHEEVVEVLKAAGLISLRSL